MNDRRPLIDRQAMTLAVMSFVLGALVFNTNCGGDGKSGAVAVQSGSVTSVAAGSGLVGTPNPIVGAGTLSVDFAGNGAATTVARSDHNHDAGYLQLTGGTVSGNLNLSGNQAQNLRVHNSATPPAAAGAGNIGQLWFDTTSNLLKVSNGTAWVVAQTGTDHQIHVSTVGGVVVVPASFNGLLLRQITFTPDAATDYVENILVEGTFNVTAVGGSIPSFALEVLDATGVVIRTDMAGLGGGTGVGIPYSVSWMPYGLNNVAANPPPSFPSSSYTIRLRITTGTGWIGQLNSTQFRIVTSGNVKVVNASPNITG